jgi:hypothetical protein
VLCWCAVRCGVPSRLLCRVVLRIVDGVERSGYVCVVCLCCVESYSCAVSCWSVPSVRAVSAGAVWSGLCRVLESGLCRVRWCRVVLCRVSVLDRIVLRIVYVYGLVWSCYVSCVRVMRIGLVWLCGSVYESYGSVSSRVLDRFGIRAERHAERLCIATRIAPPTRRIRRQCDNIYELKIYTMTFTLSNFKFQIYYSNDFKLYDLVITYNNQFHSHYHLSNKKQINKIINKTLKQLK